MRVVADGSDPIARLGEVAIWSFELPVWGECAQASTETEALERFSGRTGIPVRDLQLSEEIRGPRGVFAEDLLPATDAQVARTVTVLDAQRALTIALLESYGDDVLDARDPAVKQPPWMTWRTPREILRHIADTEARAYLRWCGLPQLGPVHDLRDELRQSARHVREVITTMPRNFLTEHRGETWTPVKLLRRLAWHERIGSVFLRQRLSSNK